jgi:cation diffusion facilitator CzcD-associated flavoprotein CzcO
MFTPIEHNEFPRLTHPKPDWPKFLSVREDIWDYLGRVCKVFNLRRNMKFNSRAIETRWDDSLGIWCVKIRHVKDDGVE